MKTLLAALLVLTLVACAKKEPPPAPAGPPVPGPTPLELRCGRTLDHVAKIVAAAPNVPAETKKTVAAERVDPTIRAKRIADCMKQDPELTTCFLEATNLEVVMGCAVKYVPLPPDPADGAASLAPPK